MADEQVLIITNSAIGDAILTTGVIDRIVRNRPAAHFTIVCSPVLRALFEQIPARVTTIPLVKKRAGGHWLDLLARLGRRRWAAIYDFRNTGLSHVLRGPSHRIWPNPADDRHKVYEAATLLGLEDTAIDPVIWLDEAAIATVPEALDRPSTSILALGPGANLRGKAWPVERFCELALRLTAKGAPLADAVVLVTGGSMDRVEAQAIAATIDRPDRFVDLTGTDLLQTSAALTRASLFIGNDSGMMHLAAASGAPTLGLFGPTDERRYGPWGPRSRAVRSPDTTFTFGKISRTVSKTQTQMDALGVDQVERAAHDLLSQRPNPQ